MNAENCFHCGLAIENEALFFDEKQFCCQGCKTVYEIFSLNDMTCYYDFEASPGASPQEVNGKYDFLDNETIEAKLLKFKEKNTAIVSLNIPHIHCSSCIWILENLQRLEKNIISSQVNFLEKKVQITYNSEQITLKNVVYLLSKIGYEPYISLENYEIGKTNTDRSLTYKLGVAFFCFGNIMLLSFPEYFEVNEFWLDQYKPFFRWLIFILALPSFIYSASGYYISAYKNLKIKSLDIDIPIALGIIVMFIRSTFDIILNKGSGFFDSLTGLVFFMLLGKMFQLKTYKFLNFERDFKSYFPIAVTKIEANQKEVNVPVYEIVKGDKLLIRNQELIPVDGILISEKTAINYSFVTGEAVPINKKQGETLFAGGKQMGNAIEMIALNPMAQSYLTQLWSNSVFQKEVKQKYQSLTNKISQYFTPALLLIAFLGFFYWIFRNTNTAYNVFTAVLIVACPCALALTAPFTMGNMLRIFGRKKCYLKNALVIEQLAKVNTIVFDKTGTLTSTTKTNVTYQGKTLTKEEEHFLKNILRISNHPLSRMLYEMLPETPKVEINHFEEITGKGIFATINNTSILIGSAEFVGKNETDIVQQTAVHIKINNIYLGKYLFKNKFRNGLKSLFNSLSKNYEIIVLSGDNEGDKADLKQIVPQKTQLIFNKKPEEKLEFIAQLQLKGKNVMMIGDGLNDAGALAQSNVGIAIAENINVFSPACDAILDATAFNQLFAFLKLSKKAISIIKKSFFISILYNVVGLYFALTGNLDPLVAAIIMPLSTVTIISFVTLMSNYYANKL